MAPVWKRPGVLLGGAAVYGAATLGAYLTFYEPKPRSAEGAAASVTDARRLQVFNANAPQYDRDVGWDETLMGVSLLRRVLLRQAEGRVLEVAAGTGRNVAYYPAGAQLTLTDFSEGMLAQARAKAPAAELRVMSASALQFPGEEFDAVVDTFGLCSMDEPVAALKEMQRVCRRGGRLLLLEHGRSSYAWLSSVLDKFADAHAEKWGCHWNRDILALVEQAGLEVETVRRFHFGTTYYIVAKPREGAGRSDGDQASSA